VRLLVAGAGGMLGGELLRAGARAGHLVVGLPRAELDILDGDSVDAAFARVEPDAVLNCAAWTDVDGAEGDPDGALAVNGAGAGTLARAAAAASIPLLHVSTDYVFSGRAPHDRAGRPRAYLESDAPDPRSAYGRSKLAGEREVLAASSQHIVARTAWLFGLGGRNFAATMLELAQQCRQVQVVNDQSGCPTWTGHLAPALLGLLERGVRGLVHLAGAGTVTWNGFAREIFRQAELDCEVLPATSAEMARPAPRPAWSALESEREDVLPLPPWQDGLAGYLAARAGMIRT
jgi:dTDP-4-dehydrorhamnose reductase